VDIHGQTDRHIDANNLTCGLSQCSVPDTANMNRHF